jgi:hypothetical protein
MKAKGRYSISLLLIGLILFNSFGYYLMLPAWHWFNHKEILNSQGQVLTNDLIHFSVAKNHHNTEKFSRGKEFLYKGDIYDVIEINENATTITYTCIRDHKDNKIIKSLKDNSQEPAKQNPSKRSNNNLLDGIIKTALLSRQNSVSLPVHSVTFCYQISQQYISPWLSTPDLPPQFS